MKKTLYSYLVFLCILLTGCQYNTTFVKKSPVQMTGAAPLIVETDRVIAWQAFQSTLASASTTASTMLESSENLDTKEYNWYFKYKGKGTPPDGADDNGHYRKNYNCSYIGDTSQKNLFLTFDQGYENGFTPKILDVLKKHNVKAAFFCVKPYLTTNPELIKRMVDEGHIVCNHSNHHPSMAKITDMQKFRAELTDVETAYEQITNQKMPKYFRPPMGKYSELSLKYTKDCGYKTIFWSFAYMDWDTNKQPDKTYAKQKILDRIHNGSIILLHSVSKTNAEILEDVIVELQKQGYVFKSLDEL